MNIFDRINATLHNEKHDRVPFVPYDNLIPRGEFERQIRNRGVGLCKRISTISTYMPDVSIETKVEDDIKINIYHTPVGNVESRSKTVTGRISDSETLEYEGLIKEKKDYEPVIFMIENTRFSFDKSIYFDNVRDLGNDGIVRDWALDFETSPYGSTKKYFGEITGLDKWIYAQIDHPDYFKALLEAQTRRDERRLALVEDSPAEFLGLGWIEGIWGPEQFKKYELEFYKKWVSFLQSKNKICTLHCDATKSLKEYKDLINEIGFKVIEAFTPPPVGELSIKEVREAWGDNTIIWLNVPETIFYSGYDVTKEYIKDLLINDRALSSLILSFTEMGLWGITNDNLKNIFREGTIAVIDAIDEYGILN